MDWLPITVLLYGLTAVAAYFLGCFNGAVIVSQYILRNDVRNHGSGNAGLTNFYRTFGGLLTFVVILCDMLKAAAALLLAAWVFRGSGEVAVVAAKYWAAAFCLFGHMYPCMFEFRGGKGVLSGGTIALMLDWRIALIVWGGFLLFFLLTRYVSLGSCVAGASFPLGTVLVYHPLLQDPAWVLHGWFIILCSFFLGGLVVWKHRANIRRLIAGNESKFSFRKKKGDVK